MQILLIFKQMNANARFGVIALLLGALGISTTIWIDGAVPMQLLSSGTLLFGQLAYGQDAGFEKPLTKLVLVALGLAVIGFVMLMLDDNAKAGLLFVFATFLSILFWAVAMLHRPGPARATGKVGAAMGLGVLRSVASAEVTDVLRLVQITCVGLAIWSVVQAWILFTGLLALDS